MSEQSVHLRDQASKCEAHARAIGDNKTRDELQKLAAEYIERAAVLESLEGA